MIVLVLRGTEFRNGLLNRLHFFPSNEVHATLKRLLSGRHDRLGLDPRFNHLTRLHILLYTLLLALITMLPFVTGMSGAIYLFAALLLDAVFLYYAISLKVTRSRDKAMETFVFSIIYLLLLFAALLLDRYLLLLSA